jgi:hypothetical protein
MLHLKTRIGYNGNFTWLSSFQFSEISEANPDYQGIMKLIRKSKGPRVDMLLTHSRPLLVRIEAEQLAKTNSFANGLTGELLR